MKTFKTLVQITASLLVLFGANSCANEDDDTPACQICTYTYNGQTYTEEFCPEDFDSADEFNSYISALELLGSDCD